MNDKNSILSQTEIDELLNSICRPEEKARGSEIRDALSFVRMVRSAGGGEHENVMERFRALPGIERFEAIAGLEAVRTPAARAVLLGATFDADDLVRARAAAALADRMNAGVERRLISMLSEAEPSEARTCAAMALRRSGSPEAARALQDVLGSDDKKLVCWAAASLKNIGGGELEL